MNAMVFELKIAILGTAVYNLFGMWTRKWDLKILSIHFRDKEIENMNDISGDIADRMRQSRKRNWTRNEAIVKGSFF